MHLFSSLELRSPNRFKHFLRFPLSFSALMTKQRLCYFPGNFSGSRASQWEPGAYPSAETVALLPGARRVQKYPRAGSLGAPSCCRTALSRVPTRARGRCRGFGAPEAQGRVSRVGSAYTGTAATRERSCCRSTLPSHFLFLLYALGEGLVLRHCLLCTEIAAAKTAPWKLPCKAPEPVGCGSISTSGPSGSLLKPPCC